MLYIVMALLGHYQIVFGSDLDTTEACTCTYPLYNSVYIHIIDNQLVKGKQVPFEQK